MRKPWAIDQFRPATPHGRKPCTTCFHTLALTNEHSRCHRCRAAGKVLHANCSECGKQIVKTIGRKTCSKACHYARHNRLRREKTASRGTSTEGKSP